MHAQDITEGRRLLAALTKRPYGAVGDPATEQRAIVQLTSGPYGMHTEKARAVLWLLEHADELLRLAERVAAVQVQTDAEQRAELASAVKIMGGAYVGVSAVSVMPMLAMAVPELLADAAALAALVEAVRS